MQVGIKINLSVFPIDFGNLLLTQATVTLQSPGISLNVLIVSLFDHSAVFTYVL